LTYKQLGLLFREDETNDINISDRLMIPLGFRPEYNNIKKHDFLENPPNDLPKNSSGSVEIPLDSYIDTRYKLFGEKKDWTLFVDFTYKYIPGEEYKTQKDGASIIRKIGNNLSLLGCWNSAQSFGINVYLNETPNGTNQLLSDTYGP
jgi:hypothetical protein